MFKIFSKFLLILFLLSTSCATVSCQQGVWGADGDSGEVLPRTSFLKIEKLLKIKFCDPTNPEDGITKTLVSSGSGFVIKNDNDGSYLFTAGHVCDDSDIVRDFTSAGAIILERKMIAVDIDKERHQTMIIDFTMCEDMCIAYAPGLYRPPVKLALRGPQPGDAALNLAAPLGVFDAHMIPILHGHYSGIAYGGKAIYTIPAIGGSSGSGVFNTRGQLVGMIHSSHVRFQFLSLSPTFKEISDYIRKFANRKALLKTMVDSK